MNARERMLAAMDRKPVDRIPTDIWYTPEVHQKLSDHFGSFEAAQEALHIDGIASVISENFCPPLPPTDPDEMIDYWSIRRRRVAHGTGAYYEQSTFPLAKAKTVEDLDRYDWPQADWFDYKGMRAAVEQAHEHHAVRCGYMAPLYLHNQLRGLELSLMDPYEDADLTRHLLDRLCGFYYEHHVRIFETCDGLIDLAQVTDDLGTQTGSLLSPDVWRQFYKPHVQRFIDLCHAFGIRVFHHDDGAIRDFLPDLVEMGIDVLNPIQWRCPGMDMAELKRDFGDRIAFHGAIDNQQTLARGTPDEVRAEVRRAIDELACDGTGYVVAPCHNLQPVTSVENIIAMYDEAHQYGRRER